jgi:methylmalonyl-CoA carboxyltransferase large subunit
METATDLESLILELKEQVRELSERLARVEAGGAPSAAGDAAEPPAAVAAPAAAPVLAPAAVPEPPPAPEPIAEEELAAIAAAIEAYLGVRAHIRQIRLISSSRWAQEGRVSIQASHQLH